MRYPNEKIEEYRRNAGELENELIDEYKGGNLTRRELIKRGSVLGMSLPFLGLLAGGARAAVTRPQAAVRRTATTLRFGGVIPDGVDIAFLDCAPASPGRTVVGASGNSSLRREGSSLPAIFVASTSSEKFKLSAQARGLPANASSSTTSRGSNWCPVSQNSSGNFPGCMVTKVFTPRVKASSSSRTSGEIASHTLRKNSFWSGR